MKAIIYSRVSTDAQERDGTSLDTQERACEEFAAERGWQVIRRIRDAGSGALLEREGLADLRAALRQGEANAVVAYAVDRLSRSQNHIGILFDEFEGAGVTLEFVTERFEDTAVGRFILAARAFIAEVEREKIAERTMRGKEERARSGRIPQANGSGIYGYHYDRSTGRRVVNDPQAAVVRRMFEEFAGGASIIGITNALNEEGARTYTGKAFSTWTVRNMLLNPAYAGRTFFKRTRTRYRRDPVGGRRRRVREFRDESEWIEVPDATPAVVPEGGVRDGPGAAARSGAAATRPAQVRLPARRRGAMRPLSQRDGRPDHNGQVSVLPLPAGPLPVRGTTAAQPATYGRELLRTPSCRKSPPCSLRQT